RSLRTQQRALVKCQFIPRRSIVWWIARNSFGSKSNPLGLALDTSVMMFLFGQIELVCPGLIPVGWAFFFYGEFDPGSG
ncbi:hypothetical protein ABTF05_21980, partial [Acinetobacter baumannii]